MSHRLLQDPDQDGWERSDFPIVCESCLGPNPYIRMQRIEFGGTCNISGRPYTVFRWRPGTDARYKKTIICQEVAKAKNVCQVCLLDLEYGLPVQVRDKVSGVEVEDIPNSDVNKEYMLELHKSTGELGQQYKNMPKNETLQKLSRDTPHYERNLQPICTFFVRGECNRGAECPFRHEMPTAESEVTEQTIKDRYYGVDDPVAKRILDKMEKMPTTSTPEDPSITSLFVSQLPEGTTEEDLRDQFYAYGEITEIKVMPEKRIGFVHYASRAQAERAMEELDKKVKVKDAQCRVAWGKPVVHQKAAGLSRPSQQPKEALYPSMDSSAMGSYMPLKRKDDTGTSVRQRIKKSKSSIPVPKPPPGPPPSEKN